MPTTVLEFTLLGRHPYQESWLLDSAEDAEIAHQALREFGLEEFSERSLDTLSGGELQRLALARLVTQSPTLYLLDEPSNHLDMGHQTSGLLSLRDRVKQGNAAMLMATHDINLAARICDRFVLLTSEGYVSGELNAVLTEANLSDAYCCTVKHIKTDAGNYFFAEEPARGY